MGSLWETVKDYGRDIWNTGKNIVQGAKSFFDAGGSKMVNKLLGSAGKLGLVSGDTAKNIGRGLSKARDITKNASELVGTVDEVGNILNQE